MAKAVGGTLELQGDSTRQKDAGLAKRAGVIPQAQMTDVIALDEAVRSGSAQIIEAQQSGNEMAKAFILARVLRQLRTLLTDAMMADVMELKGNAAGFKTDETGDKQYSIAQTR